MGTCVIDFVCFFDLIFAILFQTQETPFSSTCFLQRFTQQTGISRDLHTLTQEAMHSAHGWRGMALWAALSAVGLPSLLQTCGPPAFFGDGE